MHLQIGSELSITGEAYFALTTSCVMAGGRLCAVFKSGGIEAWFTAYADFLMSWQPFYYQAAMGITLGIALRLGEIALRLELSVDLKLQGPPFGGEARVVLWVISFTIPFGAPKRCHRRHSWRSEFVKKCLPAPKLPAAGYEPGCHFRADHGGTASRAGKPRQESHGSNRERASACPDRSIGDPVHGIRWHGERP